MLAVSWSSGTEFVNESFIGTSFTGRLLEADNCRGLPGVVPTVTGRAWITGMANYLLDPDGSVPYGLCALKQAAGPGRSWARRGPGPRRLT